MTENEAIKKIRMTPTALFDDEADKAKKMAIQALEEVQAYRAIGTVEECLNSVNEAIDKHNLMIVYKDRLKDYEAIGTIEEFKALKEKSVAKKPEPIDYEKYMDVVENAKFLRGSCWCPNCKHAVRSGAYCDDCGQALDWQ